MYVNSTHDHKTIPGKYPVCPEKQVNFHLTSNTWKYFLLTNAGILRDKTMGDKLLYVPFDEKHKILVEKVLTL